MRTSLRVVPLLITAVFGSNLCLHAQSSLPLPGCEAVPEVRKIMDEKLEWNLLDKMKFAERLAYQREVLEDLMARYPREIAPVNSYANVMHQYAPDEYARIRDSWVQAARNHPDDPLALLVAGKALVGTNTPEAIRLLESAKSQAPSFPWPNLYLASTYATGKRADQAKTRQYVDAFYALCPSSTDGYAHWLLSKDQALEPRVASALRAHLATETDPKRLQTYSILWGLEFRTHLPSEHDAIRAQVARDLKRLEALNPHGNAEWEHFFITGYKQSDASKETITAMEDRLLHDFPHSTDASDIAYERWDKAHPKPDDQTDTAAWAKYQKEYEEAMKGWVREFTDSSYFQHNAWFYTIRQDEAVTEKEGIAALDAYLQAARDHESPRDYGDYEEGAAEFLVEKKWQPARALALLEDAKAIAARIRASEETKDNLSEEDAKDQATYRLREDQDLDGLILRAAIQSGQSEPALKLKAELERPVPTEKKRVSAYWLNRARLEVIEKHPQDALAYYQLALQTRLSPPKMYRGKLEDDLTDEASALFKEQGGSETAWAVWSKPSGSAEQATEGRWEKATRQIPDFELSDMTGKTWKLKELNGKTLLINLWATWCGPCQAELPHLQKFYEKTKDRRDIQVLTFDLDEDLGVVAPYLKEKGYTFPVLPAYSTVVGLLDGFAIPQTWLVDPHGVWLSKQIGFSGGSEVDFEKEMLDRLGSATAD
jgi:thiol-disulfide isomerase/thioredoxin